MSMRTKQILTLHGQLDTTEGITKLDLTFRNVYLTKLMSDVRQLTGELTNTLMFLVASIIVLGKSKVVP